MRRSRVSLRLVLAFVGALLLAACDDDPTDTNGNNGNDTPFPSSADLLMSNFKTAYGKVDLDAYRETLGAAYQFIFQDSDVQHLGLPTDRLNCDDELGIAANMFGGGGPMAISAINVTVLDPQNNWEEVKAQHSEFPGSWRRVYAVVLQFERPGNTTIQVEGLQEFFAVGRDSSLANGTPAQYWTLIGQIDHTSGAGLLKAGETTSWGSLKVLYW